MRGLLLMARFKRERYTELLCILKMAYRFNPIAGVLLLKPYGVGE